MNPREVILLAAQHGIGLTVVGDSLRVDPLPTCRGIPDGLVDELRQHKRAVMDLLLEPSPHGDCIQCGSDTGNILTESTGESWLCSGCWDVRYGARWVAV